MSRNPTLFLRDMLEAAQHIQSFVSGLDDYYEFLNDEKTVSAVIRKFEVIGEAAKNVPDTIKEKHPEIPWKDVARMRDHLIHRYFGVDYVIVWNTIQSDIPTLVKTIAQILEDLDKE